MCIGCGREAGTALLSCDSLLFFSFYLLGFFISLSITCSFQDNDFRVIDETVRDGSGHSGALKDLSPISKGQIRRYDG